MNFLIFNIVFLGIYGLFSYFFIKNRRRAIFLESILAGIYFPIFVFFHLNNKEYVETYVIQGRLKLEVRHHHPI